MANPTTISEYRRALQAREAEVARLRAGNEGLHRRIGELEGRREAAGRAGRRQAAPFSKGAPRSHPRRRGRRSGVAHGRHGHRRRPDRVDERIAAELPEACPGCGGELESCGSGVQSQEELPVVVPRVIEIEVPIARCRQCGKRVQGRHERQGSWALGAAGAHLGPRAVAAAGLLHFDLGLSYEKTAGVLSRLLGLRVTPGGLAQAMSRLGKRCLPTYEAVREAIGQSRVVTGDETGWRVMALPAWMWHFTTPTLALYGVRSGRGYAEAITLLPETFMGILVSDGWAVYRLFLEAQRQSCLLHLMRRGHGLKEVAHGRGREIPGLVLGLLGDALLVRARRDAGELSEPGLQAEVASLRQRLDQLLSRPAVRHPGNRRLLKHLANERHALFTFLSQPGIEATN